jgi:ATP-binding cassette subfamily C (CFTR/MRP) protein 1
MASHHTGSVSSLVAALDVLASITFIPLSYLEDDRKLRPSSSLVLYLGASIFCNFVSLWESFKKNGSQAIDLQSASIIILKLLLCGLESSSERPFGDSCNQNIAPEAYSGIINRTFFWWLNDLFRKATIRRITLDDMHPLEEDMKSQTLSSRMNMAWKTRCRAIESSNPFYLLLSAL